MNVARPIPVALPAPGIHVGYQFVEPLLLMWHSEGRTLEDLHSIREDAGLRAVLQLPALSMPQCTAWGANG